MLHDTVTIHKHCSRQAVVINVSVTHGLYDIPWESGLQVLTELDHVVKGRDKPTGGCCHENTEYPVSTNTGTAPGEAERNSPCVHARTPAGMRTRIFFVLQMPPITVKFAVCHIR